MQRHPYRWPTLALASALGMVSTAEAQLDVPMEEQSARAMLSRFGYGADPGSLQNAIGVTPRRYILRAITALPHYPDAITSQVATLPSSQPLAILWERYGPGGTERMEPPRALKDEAVAIPRSEREITGHQILEAAIETRLLEMANSDNPGHEALLNFWLNHFSIHGLKAINKFLAADYARTLQQALREDSFPALLRASFLHPAMQIYLDNVRSTAPNSPFAQKAGERGVVVGLNENLARELLELHTLGVDGGYTQADILALARIISGAGVLNNRMSTARLSAVGAVQLGYFLFDPRRHDFAEKRLLGTTYPAGQGVPEIERALNQLALHPATAEHIAIKLARRFLADEPPRQLIKMMAEAFRKSGGRISATLAPLLDSPEFTTSLRQPTKFKEPLDYLISASRAACHGQPVANGRFLALTAKDFGQAPFMRTTPDGYGMQETDWLSPPAMAKRVRLAQGLAEATLPVGGPRDGTRENAFCRPDLAHIRQAVGNVSTQTQTALSGLTPQDEMVALLASPEFMRR